MLVKKKSVDTRRRKLGVVIGDNVKTGINSIFMPGVKVGINSWVGAKVMVDKDLPENSAVLLKQDYEIRTKK